MSKTYIRGYTEKQYHVLANEDEEGINKSTMGMLNDYSVILKPILPANNCRINAKQLLPNQPLNFSCPTRVFNHTLREEILATRNFHGRNFHEFPPNFRKRISRNLSKVSNLRKFLPQNKSKIPIHENLFHKR